MKQIPLILDRIASTAWAIMPAKLNEILGVVHSRDIGKLIEDEASLTTRANQQAEDNYRIKDNIAILKVHGTLSKKMNLVAALSGGTSYEMLQKDLKKAMADPAVTSIILHVDSCGGAVDGMTSLCNLVYESRAKKRIFAFADGTMASAAYFIGSAAHEVIAADTTTQVGSLGVIGIHFDRSKEYEQKGITPTVLKAGKFKAVGNEYSPLSKGDKEDLQSRLDYLYGLMVKDIARNRGASPDIVDKNMAQGRVFLGQQAITAGLVDRIESFDALMKRLKSKTNSYSAGATKNVRSDDYMKIENFNLRSIMESLQSCASLDELKSIENQCLLHFSMAEKGSKNWIEKDRAKSMSGQIQQLVALRRRQILAQPQIEKDRADYELGRKLGIAK